MLNLKKYKKHFKTPSHKIYHPFFRFQKLPIPINSPLIWMIKSGTFKPKMSQFHVPIHLIPQKTQNTCSVDQHLPLI